MASSLKNTMVLSSLVLSALIGCSSSPNGPLNPLARVEKRLVYYPIKFPIGYGSYGGMPIEDVWFQSEDGTKLHGWYLEHPNPRAVVLYCHGNGGNVTHRKFELEKLFTQFDVSVLVFDYRGYGRSEGSPNETGILLDARAARRWLAERNSIEERRVILMGRSLGGGVAVDLAANDGADTMVLISTFCSLPETASQHAGWISPKAMMTQRWDSISKIAKFQGRLLQSHGTSDRLISFEHGTRLHSAAQCEKIFVTTDGDHGVKWSNEFDIELEQLIEQHSAIQ